MLYRDYIGLIWGYYCPTIVENHMEKNMESGSTRRIIRVIGGFTKLGVRTWGSLIPKLLLYTHPKWGLILGPCGNITPRMGKVKKKVENDMETKWAMG